MLSRSKRRRTVMAALVSGRRRVGGRDHGGGEGRDGDGRHRGGLLGPAATPGNTVVRTLAAGDGAVELARTLVEQFDGAALPRRLEL